MNQEIQNAIDKGILKSVADIKLTTKEEEDSYHDGCVFDSVPEVLTKGHALNQQRISQIQRRASFSQYIILPTKLPFRRLVRTYSYVFAFAYKLLDRIRRKKDLSVEKPQCEGNIKFSIFTTRTNQEANTNDTENFQYFAVFTSSQSPEAIFALSQHDPGSGVLSDRFINIALTYLFRKAAAEVKEFNPKKTVDKIAVEQDQILFSQNRLVDGMRFAQMGDLNISDLQQMGVKPHVPVLDRFSPLSYSIARHIHDNIALHRGIETCNRFSLQYTFIMQGMSLFKELASDCMRCSMKRRKLIEVTMGPLSDHQLSITPPFWCAQVDLFGPLHCYVPGLERSTRARPAASVKNWIMVAACPVTKLINAQVVEKSDASGILDAITRLCCEVGVPSIILADSDSALIKAVRDAEVTMADLKLQVFKERGIRIEICSVGGHNEHGLVERSIQSIQGSFEECGLGSKRLTATGLQTMCKLVENDCNNIPFGFKYDRDQDNTEVLRILTPNMMRHGRINSRSLSGPLRLPHGASEMAAKVNKTYEAWFKVWSDCYVPKLLFKPKWYKSDVDLKKGDIVYFKKEESELAVPWTLGMIEETEPDNDRLIRKVLMKYRNASETQDRFTRRSIRTICKLWSEDDWSLADDLAEIQAKLHNLNPPVELALGPVVESEKIMTNQQENTLETEDDCCCKAHCHMMNHGASSLRTYKILQHTEKEVCEAVSSLPLRKNEYDPDEREMTQDQYSSLDNLTKLLLCTDGLPT